MDQYIEQPLFIENRRIVALLSPKYVEGEAKEMARIIFEQLKGWKPVDLAIRADEPISEYIHGKIDEVIKRLLADEPIQYIFGQADFYGMKLKVTPDVLIPRPETAELVDLIVKHNPGKDLRVIDLGTGSGCIAIALSRNLQFPTVTAVDLSRNALAIARLNAEEHYARIHFVEADILQLSMHPSPSKTAEPFDIIVSNPPYIADKEKSTMEANVLLHEPGMALFVPDNDPLKFYKAILDFAQEHLAPSGHIYFEINPIYATLLAQETTSRGFPHMDLERDSFGKTRFAIISR